MESSVQPLIRELWVNGFIRFLCFVLSVVFLSNRSGASDLDTLLQLHLEAIGGATAVSELNSIRSSGVVLISGQRVPFDLWSAYPNRLRIESVVGERIYVQCYDGSNPPWEWFPETIYSLPQTIEGDPAIEFMSDADFNGPLVNHQGKGHVLILEGKESLDALEVQRLALVEKSGLHSTIFIDAKSHLIVRRSGVRRGAGAAIELDTYYLDYRKVEGVLLPHRYEVYRGTTLVRTVLIQQMAGNVRIPPAVFHLPNGPDPVRSRIESEEAPPGRPESRGIP